MILLFIMTLSPDFLKFTTFNPHYSVSCELYIDL